MSQDGGDDTESGDGARGDVDDNRTVREVEPDGSADVLDAADVAREDEPIRHALAHLTDDDAVGSSVTDTLKHLSKIVTTSETRLELVESELGDARDTAEPVADIDAVRSRFDAYKGDFAALEERLEKIQESLQTVVERRNDPAMLQESRDEVPRIATAANEIQGAADELQMELKEFQRWLNDPAVRADRLTEEADAVEEMIVELETIDESLAAVEDGSGAVKVPGIGEVSDPAAAWFDAALQLRLVDLLLADLHAELDNLQTWADREGATDTGLDRVAARLDALGERAVHLNERIDEHSRPAWTDRFGDQVMAFERELNDQDPPVEWGIVQAVLEKHRSANADEE